MAELENSMKRAYIYGVIVILILVVIVLGGLLYRERIDHVMTLENRYNLAFYEVIHHMQNVQEYFEEFMISESTEKRGQALIRVWREANLGRVYLAHLPSADQGFRTSKKIFE